MNKKLLYIVALVGMFGKVSATAPAQLAASGAMTRAVVQQYPTKVLKTIWLLAAGFSAIHLNDKFEAWSTGDPNELSCGGPFIAMIFGSLLHEIWNHATTLY